MATKFLAQALLLECLPLRETLDALKGYTYPAPAREILCQRHGLTEPELAGILRLHKRLYPTGPPSRRRLDLLLDTEGLRAELVRLPLNQLLTAHCLRDLQKRYKLRPTQLSSALEAHAEMQARP